MKFYRGYSMSEDVPVQYVGVYVLKWKPEWGAPDMMFAEEGGNMENTYAELYALIDELEKKNPELSWYYTTARAAARGAEESLQTCITDFKQRLAEAEQKDAK